MIKTISAKDSITKTTIAAGFSVIINLILTAIGRVVSMPPETFGPYMYARVAEYTLIGVVGAGIVYTLMRRYMDRAKADKYFIILSVVLLVVSFYPDVALPWSDDLDDIGWTYGIMANLILMHVIAAGSVVYLFTGDKKSV